MKHIILCADDYGLNASISQGIIDLLRLGRLSAVSCLTNFPSWSEYASWLSPFQKAADIGLHFNLTEGKPLSTAFALKYGEKLFSLPQVIIRSYMRQLDITLIEQECEAQLNQFVSKLGFLPDFIDGHQHIHQLPIIREALLRVYEKHLRKKNAYVRSVLNSVKITLWSSEIKKIIIYLCGAKGFQQLLKKQAIPYNSVFAGIYSFSHTAQYAELFPRFLQNMEEGGLIMCHPGSGDHDDGDAIAEARRYEYHYLMSEQFIQDCKVYGVQIGRVVRG